MIHWLNYRNYASGCAVVGLCYKTMFFSWYSWYTRSKIKMSVIQILAFVHTFPKVLPYFSSTKIEAEKVAWVVLWSSSDSCSRDKITRWSCKRVKFGKGGREKQKGFISVFEIVFCSDSRRLMTQQQLSFFTLNLDFSSMFIFSGRICWKSVHRAPDYYSWKT